MGLPLWLIVKETSLKQSIWDTEAYKTRLSNRYLPLTKYERDYFVSLEWETKYLVKVCDWVKINEFKRFILFKTAI